ncbi:hypothetical protein A1O3_03283 [Capronia epimyces CBS 606.96]|uniref:Involucrin repeat protein n=1 Tax=Capronia epimyces CBS 606.96 TaxID=1182542 RepID=W9Y0N6_9EURO|nr:uncharacterized protein A1O3_03283 [Capronia epimyces CBS 606.96]EXJ86332.1 hypothetical protein A1O3_03283 [Capronia epimyces CBS 606.96]
MGKSSSGRQRTGSETASRSERRRTSLRDSTDGRAVTDSSRRTSGRRDDFDRGQETVPPFSDAGRSVPSSISRSAEGSFVTALTAEPSEITEAYRDETRRNKRGREYEETGNVSHRTDRTSTSETARRALSGEESRNVSRRNSDRSRRDSRKSSRAIQEDLTGDRVTDIASLPENQFPGAFPATYSKPYRPPGLAAEYYGDQGDSVASQPGVRPNPPSIVTSAEQSHLMEPAIEPRPPPEPSSLGQIGAAASYFDAGDSHWHTEAYSTPPKASKPNRYDDHGASPRTSPRPNGSGPRPQIHGLGDASPYNVPVTPIVAGAAAEYYSGSSAGAMTSSVYQTPSRPPMVSTFGSAPSSAPAGFGGSSQGHSNTALYGAGALAGAATGAYMAAHAHDEHWHGQPHPPGASSSQPAFHASSMQHAHRHRHRGPLGKLVDWIQDPDAVAQYEQYTEAIGVCKYCFDPRSSPADAPRRHHYRRRRPSSGSRYGSTTRVDKTARYSSDEERRRRSGAKKVVVGGLAAYGAAKVGDVLLKTNHDFDDTHSVKSGQPIDQSRAGRQDRDVGSGRRARYYSSSEDLRTQRHESHRTRAKPHYRVDKRNSHRRDSTSSTSSFSSSHGRSYGAAMRAGLGAAGLAAGAVALDNKLRDQRKGRSRSPSPRKKYFSKRVSPMHSYVDLSTTTTGRGSLVGFFTSPSANKRRGKKPKGFFNFANSSSSSSDADLAFGEGTVRRKDSRRRREESPTKRDRRSSTKDMIKLVAEGNALAEESDRRKGKGRESFNANEIAGRGGARSSHDRFSNDGPSVGHEDGWYDINDDDDDRSSSSVDMSLAYGEEASEWSNRDSLGLGHGGPKPTHGRGSNGLTRHEQGRTQYYPTSEYGEGRKASTSAAAGTSTTNSGRSVIHDSLPPMQPFEHRPISGAIIPNTVEDYTGQAHARDNSFPQSTRIATHSVPLRQPQPFAPVAPFVYDETFGSRSQDYYPATPPFDVSESKRKSARDAGASNRSRRDSSPAKLSSQDSRRSMGSTVIDEQSNHDRSQTRDKPRNKKDRRDEEGRRKTADLALTAAIGSKAAGLDTHETTSSPKSSPEASRGSVDSTDEQMARIERELERLYQERRMMKDQEGKQRNQKPTKGVDFAEPLLMGKTEVRGSSQGTTKLRRKPSLKKTKDPGAEAEAEAEAAAGSKRESQQESIAAHRVKSTPSPVYEDYGAFFVPKELQEHLKEHNDKAEHRDDIEANVVEIAPGAARPKRQHPFDPFHYRPFGLELDDDPMMHPWPVPLLELVEPTPPGSQTHSVLGDTSPVITARSAEEHVDIGEPLEREHTAEIKPTPVDGDTYFDKVQTPRDDPADDTPLFGSQVGDDSAIQDSDAVDRGEPGISRVWTLGEKEAEELERRLPVVDDAPQISRAWTIDDKEAEQIVHEMSGGLGDEAAAKNGPQIIEVEPRTPQLPSPPLMFAEPESIGQEQPDKAHQSRVVYQSPFTESVSDLGARAIDHEHAHTSVASNPQETNDDRGSRGREEDEPATGGRPGQEHAITSNGVQPAVPSGHNSVASETAPAFVPPSEGRDRDLDDIVDPNGKPIADSTILESTKPEPSSTRDGSRDEQAWLDSEVDFRSDREDGVRSTSSKRSKTSRRASGSDAGSGTKSSRRAKGQFTAEEERPKTPRRSQTEGGSHSLSNKDKDKKSSGFLSNLFSSSKSDVSTSSRKSSRSSRSEELAEPGLDGQKERRKKRRSRDKDPDDLASTIPPSARLTRRLSDPSNGITHEPVTSRDQSVDDGFVSAEQSPERHGESFLENRPEMPLPTVTGSQTGPNGVSGQAPAPLTELPFQPLAGLDVSVDGQTNALGHDNAPKLTPEEEAQKAEDGTEAFQQPSSVPPPSASSRRLSAIRTSDEPSSPTLTSSPTAVPLHFRRPPLSPTNARFSMSSPIASPSSPLTTPRTRQGRPKSTEFRSSTEFRPLYLVERQNYAKRVPSPETTENYPSLPSSKTSSAHPSMEDLRAEAQAQEQPEYFTLSRINADMFRGRRHSYSHWHDGEKRRESPDYLDSRSATPVPGEHQRAREREKKAKPRYEFHSPSELLQDPAALPEVPAVDEDAGLASPLPSIVSTEAEQDYMSARSRSLSSTRARSVSRGRKTASSSRSTSASWKDALSTTIAAATGVVAGLTAHTLGKTSTEDDDVKSREIPAEGPSAHSGLESFETVKDIQEVAGPEDAGQTQQLQPEAELFHGTADLSTGPESRAPAELAEAIEVHSPDSRLEPPAETTGASPSLAPSAQGSNVPPIGGDIPETDSKLTSAPASKSAEDDLSGLAKDGSASATEANLDKQNLPSQDGLVEQSLEDHVTSFVVKPKKSKKEKRKKRNALAFDEELTGEPQGILPPESVNTEVGKNQEPAAAVLPPTVASTAGESPFEDVHSIQGESTGGKEPIPTLHKVGDASTSPETISSSQPPLAPVPSESVPSVHTLTEPTPSSYFEEGGHQTEDQERPHAIKLDELTNAAIQPLQQTGPEVPDELDSGKSVPQGDDLSVTSNSKTSQADLDPLEQAFEAAVQARGLSDGASLDAAYQAFQPDATDQLDVGGSPLTTIEEESEAPTTASEKDAVRVAHEAVPERKLSKKERRKEKRLSKNVNTEDELPEQEPIDREQEITPVDDFQAPESEGITKRPLADVDASKDGFVGSLDSPNPFGNDFEIHHGEGDDPSIVGHSSAGDPISVEAESTETPQSDPKPEAGDEEWPTTFASSKKTKKGKKNKKRQALNWDVSEPAATEDTVPSAKEGNVSQSTVSAGSENQSESLPDTRAADQPVSLTPKDVGTTTGEHADASQPLPTLSEEPWEMSYKKPKKSKKKSLTWADQSCSGQSVQDAHPATTSRGSELIANDDSSPSQGPLFADKIAEEPLSDELRVASADDQQQISTAESVDASQHRAAPPDTPEGVETPAIADALADDAALKGGQDTLGLSEAVDGQEETAHGEVLHPGDLNLPEDATTPVAEQGQNEATIGESGRQMEFAQDLNPAEQTRQMMTDTAGVIEDEASQGADKTSTPHPDDLADVLVPNQEIPPAEQGVTSDLAATPDSHVNVEPPAEQHASEEDFLFPVTTKKSKKDKKKKKKMSAFDDLEAPSAEAPSAEALSAPTGKTSEVDVREPAPAPASDKLKTSETRKSGDVYGPDEDAGRADGQEKVIDDAEDFTSNAKSKRSKKDKKKKRRDRLDDFEDSFGSTPGPKEELPTTETVSGDVASSPAATPVRSQSAHSENTIPHATDALEGLSTSATKVAFGDSEDLGNRAVDEPPAVDNLVAEPVLAEAPSYESPAAQPSPLEGSSVQPLETQPSTVKPPPFQSPAVDTFIPETVIDEVAVREEAGSAPPESVDQALDEGWGVPVKKRKKDKKKRQSKLDDEIGDPQAPDPGTVEARIDSEPVSITNSAVETPKREDSILAVDGEPQNVGEEEWNLAPKKSKKDKKKKRRSELQTIIGESEVQPDPAGQPTFESTGATKDEEGLIQPPGSDVFAGSQGRETERGLPIEDSGTAASGEEFGQPQSPGTAANEPDNTRTMGTMVSGESKDENIEHEALLDEVGTLTNEGDSRPEADLQEIETQQAIELGGDAEGSATEISDKHIGSQGEVQSEIPADEPIHSARGVPGQDEVMNPLAESPQREIPPQDEALDRIEDPATLPPPHTSAPSEPDLTTFPGESSVNEGPALPDGDLTRLEDEDGQEWSFTAKKSKKAKKKKRQATFDDSVLELPTSVAQIEDQGVEAQTNLEHVQDADLLANPAEKDNLTPAVQGGPVEPFVEEEWAVSKKSKKEKKKKKRQSTIDEAVAEPKVKLGAREGQPDLGPTVQVQGEDIPESDSARGMAEAIPSEAPTKTSTLEVVQSEEQDEVGPHHDSVENDASSAKQKIFAAENPISVSVNTDGEVLDAGSNGEREAGSKCLEGTPPTLAADQAVEESTQAEPLSVLAATIHNDQLASALHPLEEDRDFPTSNEEGKIEEYGVIPDAASSALRPTASGDPQIQILDGKSQPLDTSYDAKEDQSELNTPTNAPDAAEDGNAPSKRSRKEKKKKRPTIDQPLLEHQLPELQHSTTSTEESAREAEDTINRQETPLQDVESQPLGGTDLAAISPLVTSETGIEEDKFRIPTASSGSAIATEEPTQAAPSRKTFDGEGGGDFPPTSARDQDTVVPMVQDSPPLTTHQDSPSKDLNTDKMQAELSAVDNTIEPSEAAVWAAGVLEPEATIPEETDIQANQPVPAEPCPEDEWSIPTKKSKKKSKKNRSLAALESEDHNAPEEEASVQTEDQSRTAEITEDIPPTEQKAIVPPADDVEGDFTPISKKMSKKDKKKKKKKLSAFSSAAAFEETELPRDSEEAIPQTQPAQDETQPPSPPKEPRDDVATSHRPTEVPGTGATLAEDRSVNVTEQTTEDIPAEAMITDRRDIGPHEDIAAEEAQLPKRKASKHDKKTKKARRQFEFNGSEAPPPPPVLSEPDETKEDVLEKSMPDESLPMSIRPAEENDDLSDVSASTRERRRRRRSPPVWAGEEPEDLPNRRTFTPPHDQDIMDTALGVAAGLGFGAGDNEISKEVSKPRLSPARQQTEGWSFAHLAPAGGTSHLDANRDSGVQFESPVMPMDHFTRPRDSGFVPSPADQHPADTGLRDVGNTTVRPLRPQSPTSSTEDVSNKPFTSRPRDDNTWETPRRRPSPVETTSKERTSVLFNSSPALPTPPTIKPGSRSPEAPSSPLRRSPSIHGHRHSREDLGQKARAAHALEGNDELASNLIARAATAEVNRSTFEPADDEMDRVFSPTRTALNTIREDPVEATLPSSLGAPLLAAAGVGGLAAAAAAAALSSSSRDSTAAKSLGRSKSRTSSLRNLRSASISPYDPASAASSSSKAVVDERGSGNIVPRERDMADIYDGYGSYPGSPKSPTRPPSVRRRQSMQQIKDLETRLEQLASENRALAEAKIMAEQHLEQAHFERNRSENLVEASRSATAQLQERDAEIARLKEEVASLIATHEALKQENEQSLFSLQQERDQAQSRWQETANELDTLRSRHTELSSGMESIVRHEIDTALADKNAEILQLRQELEDARDKIRELQSQILQKGADDVVVFRDEDYFDAACQNLCQQVQGWVMRFSKYNDLKRCRSTNEVRDERVVDRFDNAVLDGSDVDIFLADRVKRRDVFMSVVMTMIWEYVFTRYLFGMDREQRQKLKALEKNLAEVGPVNAVHQWRALTLTLLSKRESFQAQRESDTEAVALEIFNTLSRFLPPPQNLGEQLLSSLRNVMQTAVGLSIEMRTQRAEYIMLPPLQPEYDTNGDLARKVYFNASLMNERSGETTSNEELERNQAVVRLVLFPLVVKKGDDRGEGDDEIVVCPAQVLVARPDKGKPGKGSARVASGGSQADRMSVDARSLRAVSTHSLGAMSGIDGNDNMI